MKRLLLVAAAVLRAADLLGEHDRRGEHAHQEDEQEQSKDKQQVEELKKGYDITDDDINQYLDVGYSVHDIAFVIDQEIKEMQSVTDDEDRYMANINEHHAFRRAVNEY
mgnify:CR=1 FL=1